MDRILLHRQTGRQKEIQRDIDDSYMPPKLCLRGGGGWLKTQVRKHVHTHTHTQNNAYIFVDSFS